MLDADLILLIAIYFLLLINACILIAFLGYAIFVNKQQIKSCSTRMMGCSRKVDSVRCDPESSYQKFDDVDEDLDQLVAPREAITFRIWLNHDLN